MQEAKILLVIVAIERPPPAFEIKEMEAPIHAPTRLFQLCKVSKFEQNAFKLHLGHCVRDRHYASLP